MKNPPGVGVSKYGFRRVNHWLRFHLSYRIARAKHFKLPQRSRFAAVAIAIACVVPMFMVTPVFQVAGIIAPPSAFSAPVQVPFKTAGQTVTQYTEAVQELINKNVGKRILFRAAGGIPYIFNNFINVPAESWIYGENQADTEVIREGNGDLFRLQGACRIEELYCRAKTKQANGACFDFSHGTPNNVRIYDVMLGNFFFNGFFMVCEKAGSFGVVMCRNIHFEEPGTRVKEYGNAAFVLGGKKKEEKRTIGVWLTDCYIGVNAVADMPKAFEIQNTDSLHMKGILIQNAGIGVRFGTEDESPLLTTNTFMLNVQCDGCTKGFFVANVRERHQWTALSAEACTEGGFETFGTVIAVNLTGSNFSANKNGMVIKNPPGKVVNTATGCNFNDNTEAGVLAETGTGGWSFSGGVIGNIEEGGTSQAFGFFSLTKCEHIHFKAVEFVKGPKAGEEQVNYTLGAESVDVDTEAQAKEHGCVFR